MKQITARSRAALADEIEMPIEQFRKLVPRVQQGEREAGRALCSLPLQGAGKFVAPPPRRETPPRGPSTARNRKLRRAILGPALAVLLTSAPALAADTAAPPRPVADTTNVLQVGEPGNQDPAKALTGKIDAALRLIDRGLIKDALYDLQYDVLPRIDGCAAQGAPDRDDWITACDAQAPLYRMVIDKIEELETL